MVSCLNCGIMFPKKCVQMCTMLYFTPILIKGAICGEQQQRKILTKLLSCKKCVRMITFSDFDSHTNPLFIDLKILKVYDVIKLQQLKLAYEYCYDLIPNDLRNLFNCNSEIHINSLTSLRSVQNLQNFQITVLIILCPVLIDFDHFFNPSALQNGQISL